MENHRVAIETTEGKLTKKTDVAAEEPQGCFTLNNRDTKSRE